MQTTTQGGPKRSGESGFLARHRLDCAMLSAAGSGRPRSDVHCVFRGPGSPEAEGAKAGYLFAVIDGDAHASKGRAAAREIGFSLLEILDDPRREEMRPDLLLHRMQDANFRCEEFVGGRASATALWLWEEGSTLAAAWAHVGDTRLYHHGAKGWRCLTRDHAKGRVLDRAIGQGDGLVIDTGRLTLRPDERLVLLNDGVWKCAPPKSVVPGGPFPPTAEAVRRLVGTARLNGSRDDTSAIAIAARTIDADPEPEH